MWPSRRWRPSSSSICGHGAGAATKYTAFIAVANLASGYVTTLDGWGSRLRGLGVRGSILADIVLTAAGVVVLLALVAMTRRRPAPPDLADAGNERNR